MDNRRHARMGSRIPAVALTKSGSVKGLILDVSAGGLFFSPDDPHFMVDDNIKLEFELAGQPKISSVVKWKGYSKTHNASGVGCLGGL